MKAESSEKSKKKWEEKATQLLCYQQYLEAFVYKRHMWCIQISNTEFTLYTFISASDLTNRVCINAQVESVHKSCWSWGDMIAYV